MRAWVWVLAGCGRVSFGEPDAVDVACTGYGCVIDAVAGTTDCAAPVTPTAPQIFTIDMTGRTELALAATICDPAMVVLHLADSPTCDTGGGDGGSSSNDAEAYFYNATQFQVEGNDFSPLPTKLLLDQSNALAATGCTDVEMTVRDQDVVLVKPVPLETTSQYALRLNPPTDVEGTPDALWYLGVNHVAYSLSPRSGTGVQRVALCLR